MLLVKILAAAVCAVASVPIYTIPKELAAVFEDDRDCIYPRSFQIDRFSHWSPAPGNAHSEQIKFNFLDKLTDIATSCHYNTSSVNVAPSGVSARYACNDFTIEFVWKNGTLWLWEQVCPSSKPTVGKVQAVGPVSMKSTVRCSPTVVDSAVGEGTDCCSFRTSNGTFVSLSRPPPEKRLRPDS